MTIKPKLIVYEINELPVKLLNYYLSLNPNGGFGSLISSGHLVSTICTNKGELHPWSTWPTFHRGVTNTLHNINYINQDLTEINPIYPPIWLLLNQKGISTGVFGSLQSYPPNNNKNSLFYLPDTFAPDSNAYPQLLSIFQQFNLKLVSQNKATAGKFSFTDVTRFLYLVLRGSFSFQSVIKTIFHPIKELFSKKERNKRSLFQALLSFDLYYKHLSYFRPQFSTYFTNHLAGMMHRYWIHVFPDDFPDPSSPNIFYRDLVVEALDISDKHLLELKNFCDKNNTELLVASSMGQAAIDRGTYYPEYIINNSSVLISFLGLSPTDYVFLLSMQPDIIVECNSFRARDLLLEKISLFTDSTNLQLLRHRYSTDSLRVNLSLATSKAEDAGQNVFYNGNSFKLSQSGLKVIHRHKGTAYHTPDGIVIGYGPTIQSLISTRNVTPMDTTCFKDIILDFYDF